MLCSFILNATSAIESDDLQYKTSFVITCLRLSQFIAIDYDKSQDVIIPTNLSPSKTGICVESSFNMIVAASLRLASL